MNIENHKLFIVEFGKPDSPGGGWISFSSGERLEPVYVIAKSYNEAGRKAIAWAEGKVGSGVVGEDGSLKLDINDISVKCIKVAADQIII